MLQRFAVSAGLSVLFAASAAAQLPKYLDVFTVKIKPEKHADFMTAAKRLADANRRNQGDYFLAWGTEYGEPGITFTTRRSDLAAIERGMDMFRKATHEAFGAGAEKFMQDLMGSTSDARAEVRAFRWDLARHAPEQQDDIDRVVGNARWIRTITLRVKPDRRDDFEGWMRDSKAAMEKADPEPAFIAQSYVGQEGVEYYVTHFAASLGDFDKRPTLREMLGEEGYNDYMKRTAEDVISARITLGRAMPEISNVPESIVNVSRDFWTPKTATTGTAARKAKK